jgi:hypothetical protein
MEITGNAIPGIGNYNIRFNWRFKMTVFCRVFIVSFLAIFLLATNLHSAPDEKGLIFYADFDNGLDAVVAQGSPKASIQGGKNIVWAKDKGVKGGAALVNGGKTELRYETAGNLNPETGTIVMFAGSDNFYSTDKCFRVFFDAFGPAETTEMLLLYKFFSQEDILTFLIGIHPKRDKPQVIRMDASWRPGQWHQLAATWGDGKMTSYIDGQKLQSVNLPEKPMDFGKYFFIGASVDRWGYQPAEPDTLIDELRIYNRALGPEEIQDLFKQFNLAEINKKSQQNLKGEKLPDKKSLISMPRAARAPVIDGIINPEEWQDAAIVGGAISLDLKRLAANQARFLVTYDDKKLYIGMLSPIPPGGKLTGEKIGQRDDGNVCQGDALEVYLDPNCSGDPQQVIQFLGNFHGDIFDRKGTNLKWNANWEFRNHVTDKLWSAELAIPFAELGIATPANNAKWGINLCRDFASGNEKWTSLAGTTYGDSKLFPTLVFTEDCVAAQSPDLTGLDAADKSFQWRLVNPAPKGKNLRVFSRWFSSHGNLIDEKELEQVIVDGGKAQEVKIDTAVASRLQAGETYLYEFAVKAGRTADEFYRLRIPLKFISAADRVEHKLSPAQLKEMQDKFAKPWRGNRLGIDHSAPPPWTPVEYSDGKAHVYGRTYDFASQLLPKQITSQDRQFLANPVSLLLKMQSGTVDLAKIPVKEQAKFQDEVILKGTLLQDNLTVTGTAGLEFDGMARFDLKLVPAGKVNIDSLELAIPINPEYAEYAHYFLEKWQSAYAGNLPNEGLHLSYKRQVWIGDNDVGLAWFSPGMKGWRVKYDEVITSQKNGKECLLKIKFIDHPVTLDQPLDLTFGLMATPVKPRPKDWHKWQEIRSLYDKKITGNRDFQIPWRYQTAFSTPVPGDPKEFAVLVKQAQAEGKTVIPYASPVFMGKQLLDIEKVKKSKYEEAEYKDEMSPEYRLFYEQWQSVPPVDWGNAVVVCPNSEWADYLVWSCNELTDKYNTEGYYFDCCFVNRCSNDKHGCGYFDEDGKQQAEYPIFAQREMKKRVYKLLKSKKKDSLIVDHTSALLDAPLLSFCDIAFDGEQVSLGANDDYYDFFPLDKMRAEFTCRQWGYIPWIMSMFKTDLEQVQKNPEPTEQFIGLALLHDSLVCILWSNRQAAYRYFALCDKFGLIGAEFLPYWGKLQAAATDNPNVKISAYKQAGKTLLIVGNTSPQPQTATIALNPEIMGIKQIPNKALGLYHGVDFPITGGKITVPLTRHNFQALEIKDAAK